MRKSKGTPAQPPAPKGSRLSPSPSRIPKKIPAVSAARSAEDIPRRVHLSCSTELTPLRSMSPGSNQGKLFLNRLTLILKYIQCSVRHVLYRTDSKILVSTFY